jgi:hypothetical protein
MPALGAQSRCFSNELRWTLKFLQHDQVRPIAVLIYGVEPLNWFNSRDRTLSKLRLGEWLYHDCTKVAIARDA